MSRRIETLKSAWPIILANSAAPLLGLVDTALMGHWGSEAQLASIAIGTMLFNFLYWSFGFLRMSTTGFVAQAAGRGDELELRKVFSRGVIVAFALAAFLILGQVIWQRVGLRLLGAEGEVLTYASRYFSARIWGAPATLLGYVASGVLVGIGATRQVLWVQLLLNISNGLLDLAFVRLLHWGPAGLGAGTAIASWLSLALALFYVVRILRGADPAHSPFQMSVLNDWEGLKNVMRANLNLMARTLLLLGSFALFTWRGGQFGTDVLAANHLLLQYVSFSAFFLDGFAFVAEASLGAAFGRGDRAEFIAMMRTTSELAVITGFLLAAVLLITGQPALQLLTSLPGVLAHAHSFLPYAVAYIACSAFAFQLDGAFIGVTATRALRNSAIASFGVFLIFLALLWPLHNAGLWIAFCIYLISRAVTLAIQFPALLRELELLRVN